MTMQAELHGNKEPEIKKKDHLFSLDFVRAVGTLLIVIFHYNMVSISYPEIGKPILLFVEYANGTMGHIGVSLFFILTGASLMYVYADALNVKEYMKKRFLAIFPLYWTVYGAFFVYFYLITRKLTFDFPIQRFLLTFVGLDGYLAYLIPNYYLVGEWFIGCILIIYLCFPLIWTGIRRYPAWTALAAAAAYLLLNAYYPFELERQFCFLIRIPEVMFGMYFMKYYYQWREKRERFGWRWALPSGLLFLLVFTVRLRLSVPIQILCAGVPCFLLLLWVGQNMKSKRVRYWITVISKYSFAIFLTHHILVGKFLFQFAGRTLGKWENRVLFLTYFLFVLAVSWGFSRICEYEKKVSKHILSYLRSAFLSLHRFFDIKEAENKPEA